MNLVELIRDVPDFPKKGIVFKDITTLLKKGPAFSEVIERMARNYKPEDVDAVVGIESRGFIFGGALAYKFNTAFIPVRKPGKLPASTICREYTLEYGTNTLEIHADAIKKGDCVVIIDDLLATGGTVRAVIDLVEELGGRVVGIEFLVELTFLKGREKLAGYPIHTCITYSGE